jgi:GAG-pre-integrase domain
MNFRYPTWDNTNDSFGLHPSGNRNQDTVQNLVKIFPRMFQAANKHSFKAVGMGEMTIDIPNNVDILKLRLTEALYSPKVSYTHVSIGRLDDAGFDVTFADGKCTIRERNGELVGTVPKLGRGLYRVSHESDTANLVADVLTLDQFHPWMGHISPETARRLVAKGFVTGVKLEDSPSGPFFCESCIYAKATRKPVPKLSEGTR